VNASGRLPAASVAEVNANADADDAGCCCCLPWLRRRAAATPAECIYERSKLICDLSTVCVTSLLVCMLLAAVPARRIASVSAVVNPVGEGAGDSETLTHGQIGVANTATFDTTPF
jgi:hypothetical protein